MRISKKIITGLMFCLIITCTTNLVSIPAASKIKLNKTNVTIYVGDTRSLKVTGTNQKVKWSSSNKTIATVNSKGKVTGKKTGTATITAKTKNKNLKCKVKVKSAFFANKTSVDLMPGETGKVIITFKKNESVSCEIDDTDIASHSWGEWSGDIMPLTIKAKSSGDTTATLTNDYNNEKIKIKISVANPYQPSQNIQENYQILADYMIDKGNVNKDGQPIISFKSKNYSTGIIYDELKSTFEFAILDVSDLATTAMSLIVDPSDYQNSYIEVASYFIKDRAGFSGEGYFNPSSSDDYIQQKKLPIMLDCTSSLSTNAAQEYSTALFELLLLGVEINVVDEIGMTLADLGFNYELSE